METLEQGRHLDAEVTDSLLEEGVKIFARRLRQAARGGRPRASPRPPRPAVRRTSCPLPLDGRRARDTRGLAGERQSPPALGARRHALDRRRRGRAGSAGSTSPTTSSPTSRTCERSRPRPAAAASRMRCCSAWAAPASRRKSSRRPSARLRASPRCTCWIRPIPPRSRHSKARSTSARRSSSCRASRGARSSRTSSSSTSSSAPGRSVGPRRSAAASSRSPIRARRCSRSPRPTASATSSSAAVHRRPLLGALGLRHGARRDHGARRRPPPGPGGRDGEGLRLVGARGGQSRGRARHDHGRLRQRTAATR